MTKGLSLLVFSANPVDCGYTERLLSDSASLVNVLLCVLHSAVNLRVLGYPDDLNVSATTDKWKDLHGNTQCTIHGTDQCTIQLHWRSCNQS